MIYLNYVWYDDRYWFKILFSTIPTPGNDLQIKITDLEIVCLSFTLKFLRSHSLFLNSVIYLN